MRVWVAQRPALRGGDPATSHGTVRSAAKASTEAEKHMTVGQGPGGPGAPRRGVQSRDGGGPPRSQGRESIFQRTVSGELTPPAGQNPHCSPALQSAQGQASAPTGACTHPLYTTTTRRAQMHTTQPQPLLCTCQTHPRSPSLRLSPPKHSPTPQSLSISSIHAPRL